ncbi:MAG: hypothetical protein HYY84_17920 [Deltaproteobacteria bacterium]|nr:hypothetical protein [Deltaproteobacteria bacterium]
MKTAKAIGLIALIFALGARAADARQKRKDGPARAVADWTVEKFCGEFPAVCQVIRDGRSCMERLASVNRARVDAVRRVWQAVPGGLGQIVLSGWSAAAVTALGRAVVSGSGQILSAARGAIAECGKWAVATAEVVGEKLCTIDPGPVVCPVVKAAAECFAAAKRARLPSKVWAGLEKWQGGVSAITKEIVRGFRVVEAQKAVKACQDAVRVAGKAVETAIDEKTKLDRELREAAKNLDCGAFVGAAAKATPMTQALKAFAPEFVSTCSVQFTKGFVCEIPSAAKAGWNLFSNVVRTAWDNKVACGIEALLVAAPNPTWAPIVAFSCGLRMYILKQAPLMQRGLAEISSCLSKLKAKEWFNLIMGAVCEIAGAVTLELAIVALTEGGALGAWLARIGAWIETNNSLLRGASAAKAIGQEIIHTCGGGGHAAGGGSEHESAGAGHSSGGRPKTESPPARPKGSNAHSASDSPVAPRTSVGKPGSVKSGAVNFRESPSTHKIATPSEGASDKPSAGKPSGTPARRADKPGLRGIKKTEECRRKCVKTKGKNKGCLADCLAKALKGGAREGKAPGGKAAVKIRRGGHVGGAAKGPRPGDKAGRAGIDAKLACKKDPDVKSKCDGVKKGDDRTECTEAVKACRAKQAPATEEPAPATDE